MTVHGDDIYLSASNPQAANATAAFLVKLDRATHVATLAPTFADNATATNGVTSAPVTLALTDPELKHLVPAPLSVSKPVPTRRPGDQQLIFAKGLEGSSPQLTQLPMTHGGQTAGVDDVRFATSHTLLVIDNAANVVYRVTGHFPIGQAYASLDTVGTMADNSEVDTLNLVNGQLAPFITGLGTSKGLLFVSNGEQKGHGDHGHGDQGQRGQGDQGHSYGHDRGNTRGPWRGHWQR